MSIIELHIGYPAAEIENGFHPSIAFARMLQFVILQVRCLKTQRITHKKSANYSFNVETLKFKRDCKRRPNRRRNKSDTSISRARILFGICNFGAMWIFVVADVTLRPTRLIFRIYFYHN